MSCKKTRVDEVVLNTIKQKLESIEYGSVTVTVQDGKIIQIETSEKTRLRPN